MSARVVFRIRCPNIRDVEDAVPYNSLWHMLSEWPGGRGRPPLHCGDRCISQKAGRMISAPTFPHTLSQRPGHRERPGGRGRPPLHYVSAHILQTAISFSAVGRLLMVKSCDFFCILLTFYTGCDKILVQKVLALRRLISGLHRRGTRLLIFSGG